MKSKKFDCVLMKRKAAEKIYTKINNMTIAEALRFWNTSAGKLKIKKNWAMSKN